MSNNYLYHYYALHDIGRLENKTAEERNEIIKFLKNEKHANFDFGFEPYKSLKRLKSVIADKEIWLSRSENFNDPFEFLLYFSAEYLCGEERYKYFQASEVYKKNPLTYSERNKLIIDHASQYNGWCPYDILSDKDTYYGIYCFCGTYEHPLMWSYYASNHTGICVRFKIQKELEHIINNDRGIQLVKYDSGPGIIFGKVDYYDEPLKITADSFAHYKSEYEKLSPQGISVKFSLEDYILMQAMLSKYTKWEHEEEYRLITLGIEGKMPINSLVFPNTNEPLFLPNAIIFGARTPSVAKEIITKGFGNGLVYYNLDIEHGTYKLLQKPYR